jgi:hypothetical protein
MSQTAIYWYPMGSGNVKTITIPRFITNLEDDDPEVSAATSETIAGGMRRQLYGDWRRLVLIRQHLRTAEADEAEAIRDIRSLHSHLIAGYSIGIAVGTDAMWGGFTVGGAPRGTNVIGVLANTYLPWSSAGTVKVDDEVVIQSASPVGAREVHRVTNVINGSSGGKILTLATGTYYDHSGPIFVRRRTFHPHMKMPEDQLETPIVTSSSRGQTFDVRLELREDMQEVWDLAESGETLTGATGSVRLMPSNYDLLG